MRLRPRGLRVRSAAAFALLALILSVTLSVATYELARWYLLGQRENLARRQVTMNALVAKGVVGAAAEPGDDVLSSLRSISNARAVLELDGRWYAAVVELTEATIPRSLVQTVEAEGAAKQRVVVNGVPYVVIGVRLPGLDASYYEFLSLLEYRRTLHTLATVLVAAASATTVAGAAAGWIISRRLMRPLRDVAAAAQAMSAGDLSQRLDVGHDPDLEPVAESFNEMASSLEQRIARELRFTADVSHELRTPLTAMASAVGLARRSELTGRAAFAVDVLDEQVAQLRRLTLELLEISRIDAGVAELRLEETDVEVATGQVLAAHEVDLALLHSHLDGQVVVRLDRTRYERILSNLIENAQNYGGGLAAIELCREEGHLVVHVDDAGPGVPPDEREAIFGRFHRGSAEAAPERPKGTGLGLALVDEHVRLHGGSVGVTESPAGGARFVVRLVTAP
jgi:signal transduction histidine kinase